jgi:hypothetical protein
LLVDACFFTTTCLCSTINYTSPNLTLMALNFALNVQNATTPNPLSTNKLGALTVQPPTINDSTFINSFS